MFFLGAEGLNTPSGPPILLTDGAFFRYIGGWREGDSLTYSYLIDLRTVSYMSFGCRMRDAWLAFAGLVRAGTEGYFCYGKKQCRMGN